MPGASPKVGTAADLIDNTTNLSFKVGIDWQPDADALYYASISRGYRGAAFNGQAFNSPLELNFARPEQLTDYEIGSKHEFPCTQAAAERRRILLRLPERAIPGQLRRTYRAVVSYDQLTEVTKYGRGVRIAVQRHGRPRIAWQPWTSGRQSMST